MSPTSVLVAAFVVLWTTSTQVSGQCTYLTVSGSQFSDENGVNGDYSIMYDWLCDSMYVWMEEDSLMPPNYIFYVNGLYLNNGSQQSTGWVIGPQPCHIGSYARNTNGYNVYPYQVPNGTWQELNPNTNAFVSSPQLVVNCYSGLSTAAIFGIVIGSICGAIILTALLIGLCRACHLKKVRATAAQTSVRGPPSTVAYATAYPYATYYQSPTTSTTGEGSYPADFDPPYSLSASGVAQIVQPPEYDNQQPPQYDSNGK